MSVRIPPSDSWCIEGNIAWFVSIHKYELSSIMKYEFETQKLEIVAELPSAKKTFRAFWGIIKQKNYLLILPEFAEYIYRYDLYTKEYAYIDMRRYSCNRLSIRDYCFVSEGIVCMFSIGLQKLFFVDIYSFTIIKEIDLFIEKKADGNFKAVVFDEGVAYAMSYENGTILKVDLYLGEREIFNISNVNKIYCFCYDGSTFWMSGNKMEIYKWNLGDLYADVLTEFPKNFTFVDGSKKELNYQNPAFLYCYSVADKVYFIPFTMNSIVEVDKNNRIRLVNDLYDISEAESAYSKEMDSIYLCQYVREDRYLGLYWLVKNKQYEYDCLTKEFNLLKATLGQNFINKIKSASILHEGEGIDLDEFLNISCGM